MQHQLVRLQGRYNAKIFSDYFASASEVAGHRDHWAVQSQFGIIFKCKLMDFEVANLIFRKLYYKRLCLMNDGFKFNFLKILNQAPSMI